MRTDLLKSGRWLVPGLGVVLLGNLQPSAPTVDGGRLNARLEALSRFGRDARGGVTRVAYSEEDRQAREWVMALMRDAGLDVRIDTAGNLIGRRAGADPSLRALAMGSHVDSVPEGGRYDGCVGSLAAIEVVQTLADRKMGTRHPIEVLVFQNEENGQVGSKAVSGELTDADLDLTSASGKTRREGTAFLGGDPSRITAARRSPGDFAAYLELHIEQGGVLDAKHLDIGVVEGIVGIGRWMVTFDGDANHAGTTPMDQRRDALVVAARFIDAVNRLAVETPGRQVATVGQLRVEPNAPNVIAGRVELSLEIRDLDRAKIRALFEQASARAGRLASETGTRVAFRQVYDNPPAPTDEGIRQIIEAQAHGLGLSTFLMPSGAGHDAQSVARLTPVGMIFIPSVGGYSHSAKEYSTPAAIANGANVLLKTLLELDGKAP
jgi:N-carbamoyl-L-amino-acid hydrolase